MAEIKEFRLGGAGRFCVTATGSKTRSGVVYTKITLHKEGYAAQTWDVTRWAFNEAAPLARENEAVVRHITAIILEARKHLAMGSV